jgi:hypothetical protein
LKGLILTYLLATGIGAMVVVALPGLVTLGYFFLIIPGLILSALPMAFLLGALFALAWFPLHGIIGDWPAAGAAVLFAASLLYFGPVPGNRITQARYEAEIANDLVPTGPIALAGHIRIDSIGATEVQGVAKAKEEQSRRRDPKPSNYDHCTSLCAALLFTDGVQSVTQNYNYTEDDGAFSYRAATYVLVDRAQCSETVLPSGKHDGVSDFGRDIDKLLKYWNLRLSADRCIARVPTRQQHDLRIVTSWRAVPLKTEKADRMRNPLVPRSVDVERVEIVDRDGVVRLRQTRAQGKILLQPLLYLPGGDPMNPRFRWNHRDIKGPIAQTASLTVQALVDHAGLDISVDDAALARGIRTRLAGLVADPSIAIDKSSIDLVPAFFESFRDREPRPEDIDLAIGLIRDRRFSRYEDIYWLQQKMEADSVRLRGPIVDRLLVAEFGTYQELDELGKALEKLPPGTFRQLMPNEAALLADPERRTLAPGLIRRQSDRGAEAAPMLVALLAEQLEWRKRKSPYRSSEPQHGAAITAATDALTRIGPDASAMLGSVEQLAKSGMVDQSLQESDRWTLMLMRLGKPVEEIPEPKNPSVIAKDYHARLRFNLEQYERDLQKGR